ncbi:neuronal acetylcholine receptor subunit non-alpha-2-like [Periplaneta americana]|uniref:neuronal acetylcholine receptor subunit non-alpha-2-like n=1 Tax=Periplaneta americana TaxID=6978 RepID=UPI0037E8C073
MYWIKIVLLFLATCLHQGWCDGECKRQAPVTDETRLRNKLKCGYDITVRPQDNENHRNRTEVFLHLLLRHIILDEEYDTIGVYFGLWMYWYDERLKWNPSDYGNIKNIPAESNTIWMPQIGWVTMNIVSDRLYSPDILCTLFHNGHVSCLSRSSFHTVCKSDLTHWPYDSHVCDALMAPWRLPEDELELLASNMGDEIFSMYQPNKEWAVLKADIRPRTEKYENSTYEYLELAFSLARRSATYEAIVVIPALVLSMLTLASSWIEAESGARLGLLSSILVCHILYLQFISLLLYENGNSCPLIVVFYRDSLMICGSCLVITLLVRWTSSRCTAPPSWVTAVAKRVQENRTGQLLLFLPQPRTIAETGEVEPVSELGGATWHIAGKLLDRVSFVVFSVVYLVLFIVYYCYYL